MRECLLGIREVLRRRVFAVLPGLPPEHCGAGQRGNRHAPTFAERGVVVSTVDTVESFVARDHALGARFAPTIEDGFVEVSGRVQDAMQVVRTEERFRSDPLFEAGPDVLREHFRAELRQL